MLLNLLESPEHHFYIIYNEYFDDLKTNFSKDLHVIEKEEGIGVDDMQWISEYATSLPGSKKRRVVIYTPAITVQAQNALLKVLEELQEGIFFFLCVPEGIHLLDTLTSRCIILSKREKDEQISKEFKTFINSPIKERIKIIDEIWDLGEQARKGIILAFLQNMEIYIHKNLTSDDAKHIERCKKVKNILQKSIVGGAMNKTTLHLFAFI